MARDSRLTQGMEEEKPPIVEDHLQEPHRFHKEHEAWDYKGTIAYWVTAMTIEGALLFSLGSLMMYPRMSPTDEKHEYVAEAWVDYSFMIGGWCFLFGNYLTYLNV